MISVIFLQFCQTQENKQANKQKNQNQQQQQQQQNTLLKEGLTEQSYIWTES